MSAGNLYKRRGAVALAMMSLTPAQQPIVPSDCRPRAAERSPASRSGSTNFYDQASDSIAALYPGHRLLAERRAGTLGSVEYSLIAYQFPQCVQVRAALAGNRALILMLSAGSRQQRTAKPPGYHTGVVVQPDGALVFLKSLGEAAAAIRFP